MKIENLFLVVLAIWEVLEIWNHSALLSRWRARVELWDGFLGSLLNCMFCLAPWTALVLLTLLAVASELVEAQHRVLGYLILIPLFALATARAANLLNDIFHAICRTPKDELPEDTTHDTISEIAEEMEKAYEPELQSPTAGIRNPLEPEGASGV